MNWLSILCEVFIIVLLYLFSWLVMALSVKIIACAAKERGNDNVILDIVWLSVVNKM